MRIQNGFHNGPTAPLLSQVLQSGTHWGGDTTPETAAA